MTNAVEFQKTKQSIYSILLVDDDSSFREVIYEILTDQDYQVTKAASGEEALEVLDIRDFDLVITDLNMGVINGIEVVRKSKELHPEKTVMMMTANQDVTFFTEAKRLGVCDYLLKPFKLNDLLTRVSNCLEGV